MTFCNKCGVELDDKVKFCTKCGAPVPREERPEPAQAAATPPPLPIKCPVCGEYLDSRMVRCPSCGFVRRDNPPTVKMQEFSGLLREAQKADAQLGDNKEANTLAVIEGFVIPNTIEDLTEFMVLAESRVCNLSDVFELVSSGCTKVAAAWKEKADQAFRKGEALLADEDALAALEKSYKRIEDYSQKRDVVSGLRWLVTAIVVILIGYIAVTLLSKVVSTILFSPLTLIVFAVIAYKVYKVRCGTNKQERS